MDSSLYKKIKDYKQNGILPDDISRFAKLRFKKHYDDFELRNNELYKDNLLVVNDRIYINLLKELYKDPNTTSNGLHSFYNIVKQRYYGITFNQVQDFLKNCENYQLHKPVNTIKVIKPILRSQPGVYVQADTINMVDYGYWNNNYKYALTCIDIFSKKLWIFPLKNNSATDCARAFRNVLNDCPNLKTVHTDNGSEFKFQFDNLLRTYNIVHHFGKSHVPQGQGQIERANRTIKNYFSQYMNKYNTKIWVSAIDVFLNNYNNNRIHSTTKEVPNKVFTTNNNELIDNVKGNIKESVRGTLIHNKIVNPSIRVGDYVRVLKSAVDPKLRASQLSKIGKEGKKYKAQWTKDIYEVTNVSYRGGIKFIKVEEYDEQLKINEVQLVDKDKLFKININDQQLIDYGINLNEFRRESNLRRLHHSRAS